MTPLVLGLAPGIHIDGDHGRDVTVRAPEWEVTLRDVYPTVASALARLAASPVSPDELSALASSDAAGGPALAAWYHCLTALEEHGAVRYILNQGGRSIATLHPLAPNRLHRPPDISATQRYVLTEFAYVRRRGGVVAIESPAASARVELVMSEADSLLPALLRSKSATEISRECPLVSEETAGALIALLVHAGLAEPVQTEPSSDRRPAGWTFADLVFHRASRPARWTKPELADSRASAPVVKPPMTDDVIALPPVDRNALAERDMSLELAMASRRSIRNYDTTHPVTVDELSEFLYRVARVDEIVRPDGARDEVSLRPYPSGGARHPLEWYCVAHACDGLETGGYHYDPLHHRLERIGGATRLAGLLVETAHEHLGGATPSVLVIVAARFARVFASYRDIGYALILKEVGVVLEAMYLVATAMGLAPCALGAAEGDWFAELTDTDPMEEAALASFALGRPARSDPSRVARPDG